MDEANGNVNAVTTEVTKVERELLLNAFEDFKKIVKEHRMGGELRVAMEVDRETGEPEIIFAGYNFKRSLDATRVVYKKRRDQQITFGGKYGTPRR